MEVSHSEHGDGGGGKGGKGQSHGHVLVVFLNVVFLSVIFLSVLFLSDVIIRDDSIIDFYTGDPGPGRGGSPSFFGFSDVPAFFSTCNMVECALLTNACHRNPSAAEVLCCWVLDIIGYVIVTSQLAHLSVCRRTKNLFGPICDKRWTDVSLFDSKDGGDKHHVGDKFHL